MRGCQWLYLLDRLSRETCRPAEIFAFLLSEATQSIPIGNYFQNYLLNRSEGADIGRTSAATTAMVLSEVAVSLTGIVVLDLAREESLALGQPHLSVLASRLSLRG